MRKNLAAKPGKGRTAQAHRAAERIEPMAARDAGNPATKKADWAKSFIGAPPLKTPVNAKFDVDVVDWFKAQSRGYQSRMNAGLRW